MQNNLPEAMDKYKTYKNKLTNTICFAERLYYQEKFELAKGNMKKTWQVMKNVINPNIQNQTIDKIAINQSISTDKYIIVNTFNDYFVNVGPTLASKVPPVPGDVTDYIKKSCSNSKFLDSTDANKVCHVINTLKLSNSKGINGISSVIVKSVVVNIAIPLISIFNKSLELGKFPDKLKIAKICPIYKSDDKLLVNNYRPISILPTFSKIFERLVYN